MATFDFQKMKESETASLLNLGLWSFKKDGNHHMDENCRTLLGLTSEEPTFDNFISTIHNDDMEAFKESLFYQILSSWWQVPVPKQKIHFVLKLNLKEPRFIRGSGIILAEDNSPVEVRGFLEDVTEQKLLEEMRLERLTKMALLGELGFSINHETLNPLSVISLCTGHLNTLVLKNDIDRTKIQNCLSIMNKAVEKTGNIIKSMRIFNDHQHAKAFEKINLKELVLDSLELCQDRIRWYDIQLTIDVSPGLIVECRSVQISQILMNLVLNSILSIKDLKVKWIKIWTKEIEGKIEIYVQDSGEGIPPKIASEMMKPFFSTRNGEGTGMGLYISRNFAHQHHGRLTYDTTSPHTLFILELPLVQKK